ncbi:MAG: hypothetical protein ACFNTA_03340 [Campylobacter sp.]|uniref:hypothetical protein n=1 Tax=Campylobacter sp. TaxID=205 RepID=UPI003609F512
MRQTALKYVQIIDKGAALKYHLRETTKAIKAGGALKDYANGGEKRHKQRTNDLRTSSNKAPSKYEQRRIDKAWR